MSETRRITVNQDQTLNVPDQPMIPFIEGDGTGPDIWRAARKVIDGAVEKAFDGKRAISWLEVLAGEKAFEETGTWLPEATLDAIRSCVVAIKGPLTTPVGKGIRSINVALRQELDLYSCVRPIKYIHPVPTPVKRPELVNMVVFRENTEDVYAGIEWEAGSREARRVINFLKEEMGVALPLDAGIGIKPISEANTKRHVVRAVQYAIDNGFPSVTLMHKGNIMKFTEGAFARWGYEAAAEHFGKKVITEQEIMENGGGKTSEGRVVIKDRIADMLFQQVLLRPDEYHVIATPNLNGDYISDALTAQVGGLGMAPGANIGDKAAVFEATHGTAPKYANQDKVNPGSLILSGAMMLEHMGWRKASELIWRGIQLTIEAGVVTYDLARQMERARTVACSVFAEAIVERIRML